MFIKVRLHFSYDKKWNEVSDEEYARLHKLVPGSPEEKPRDFYYIGSDFFTTVKNAYVLSKNPLIGQVALAAMEEDEEIMILGSKIYTDEEVNQLANKCVEDLGNMLNEQ